MTETTALSESGHAVYDQIPALGTASGHVALRHRNPLDFAREWSVVRAMQNAPVKLAHLATPDTITAEIQRLAGLPLVGLRASWQKEFRKSPPKGLWRDLLLRSLAWRLQERAFGGHDKATQRLMHQYGKKGKGEERLYRRLKTGTVLLREFGGVRHTVTLVPEGFIWQEKTYSSLSAIAKIITGTNWNGPKFFGIRAAGKKSDPHQKRAA